MNEGDHIPYTPLVTQQSMLAPKLWSTEVQHTGYHPGCARRHTEKQLYTVKAQKSAAAMHEAGGGRNPAGTQAKHSRCLAKSPPMSNVPERRRGQNACLLQHAA